MNRKGKSIRFLIGFICVLVFVFLSHSSFSQVAFEAKVSNQQINEGGLISVDFVLSEEQGRNFKAPDFGPFVLYSGPSTSRSVTLINGVSSSELKYSYTLQAPKQSGLYSIGSATVEIQGKVIKTQPITVLVKEIDLSLVSQSEQEVFVRVELSKDSVFIGEPVKLEAKLYYRKFEVEVSGILNRLDYQNFVTEDLTDSRFGNSRQVINGEVFFVKNLGSRLLYPAQIGMLELGELEVALDQIIKAENFGFFQRNIEVNPLSVSSGPVTLFVKGLPAPTPQGFIGAVGRFDGKIEISDTNLRPGQGFVLKTILNGQGDINKIGHPDYRLPESVDLYKSKLIFEDSQTGVDKVKVLKVFEQFCQINQAGKWEINPYFYYFDIDKRDYVLVEEKFVVEVEGAPLSALPSILDLEDSTPNSRRIGWLLGLFGLVIIFTGMVFFFLKWQRNALDRFQIQYSNPSYYTADQRLVRAVNLLEGKLDMPFYDEIYRLWNEFMTTELGMHPGDISRQTINNRLELLGMERGDINKLNNLLEICDMSLFGGVDMSSKRREVLKATEELFLSLVEKRSSNS
jgi:hypothetical protein